MPRCPACHGEIPEGQRFCGSCGSPVGSDIDSTIPLSSPPSAPRRPSSSDRGRILPGTIVGGRYRVISLAGRGGMGEVYRADDLKLGQTVALKFLPKAREGDRVRLAHLLDEVRIARQISHPNVCRVYDVGEMDGHHFLSMEFIDGEDLASLLRRIGRLPPEKAVQIARQLCAGLAAAHDLGVLHRDLKPANVMIDGRGRARVTDFGLAGFETKIAAEEIRSGTPAYMAPEQLEGREVSVRSDIYSLGLVLYEIYTGHPAFESRNIAEAISDRKSGPPSTPASHVASIDDAVERAILRCLEPNPADRPPSALAVASALPGGDPLAAALAAGETPSPEVVAATPTEGSLSPVRALLLLAAALVLWIGGQWAASTFIDAHNFTRSPVSLADRARDLLKSIGYPEEPRDRDWGYLTDEPLVLRLRTASPELVATVRSGRIPINHFWYREGLSFLNPLPGLSVSLTNPTPETPGTRSIEMSPDGRLVQLRVFPPVDIRPEKRTAAVDWSPLFAAAELDPARFEPAPPVLMPPDYADSARAWTGAVDEPGGTRLYVEAAAWRGRPVFFAVFPDTFDTTGGSAESETSRWSFFFLLLGVLFTSIIILGSWMARRNILNGRGDRRGALRVAAFVFAGTFGAALAVTSHVPAPEEFAVLFDALAQSLLFAVIAWLLYVGGEPTLRRNSPRSIISWARVLSGRFRDPLVGRDLLIGAVGGGVMVTIKAVSMLQQAKGSVPAVSGVEGLSGLPGLAASASGAAVGGFLQVIGYLVLWQVLSLWLRSPRRGTVALGLILVFGLSVAFARDPATLAITVATGIWMAFFFTRFGLLASATMHSIFLFSLAFPMSFSPRTWFFGDSMIAIGLGALPGIYGAWVGMARSPNGRAARRVSRV
jgi:Protein kinase domain